MRRSLPRVGTAVVCMMGILMGGYVLWRAQLAMSQLQSIAEMSPETPDPAADARAPASLVSFEEIFANVGSKDTNSHTLGVKLDLELFSDTDRVLIDQRQAGVKNAIIQAALEQEFTQLNSVAGKLYFKELLVSRLNAFFNRAVVRDIHFGTFYLQ